MKFIEREKNLLDLRIAELEARRTTWSSSTKQLIQDVFSEAVNEASSVQHPFRLSSRINDDDKNEETVQLTAGVNKTGVIVEEDREINGSIHKVKRHIGEKGCSLVASFGIDGSVFFMIFPYRSDRHSWEEDCIIVKSMVDPNDVSKKKLEKIISQFFFYARFSSIKGARLKRLDMEIFRYYYLLLLDIRNRKKVTATALSVAYDWSKIIAAGAIGYFVAVAVQSS
ncbi:MAG: hypothetical protein ABJ000_17300 [Saccharospirillum sp.]|uniref:hypothetical protein n=1 Tax=Saccharospirillum sp. TaxID=2033801 RepID=UPI0032970A7F